MFKPLRVNALAAAVTAVLVVAHAAYSIHQDYDGTVVEHQVMARDLASVVADQADRSIRDTDLALKQIGDVVHAGDGLRIFNDRTQWEALQRIAARIPGGTGVLLADPGGQVVANSTTYHQPPMSVAGRDYMRAAETDRLYIGAPFFPEGRGDGAAVYTVSRRMIDRHGNLVGVASAEVATSHLTRFYNLFGFTKNPGIVVFRESGEIIARRPDIRELVGRSLADRPLFQVRLKQSSDGQFRARSPMDGIDRLNAYQRVEDAGLVVLVGIPWDAVTDKWYGRTLRTGMIAVLSVVIIGLAALWSHSAIRRAIHAQSEREAAMGAKETAYQALYHALRDHLTGLPARGLFLEQATNLRMQCRHGDDRLAVMILDLDGFKGVNDTYGHQAGDEVLVTTAATLRAALREGDVAGRLGGDEFGICITAPADLIVERARLIAGRIVERLGTIGMGIGCSLGVAICPATADGLAEALRHADEAMYLAKRSGKNRFTFWGLEPPDGEEWRPASVTAGD